MLNTLTRGELEHLMEQQQAPCISMFLPTHPAGTVAQQDTMRLRNLIREAENLLLLRNVSQNVIEELLKPIGRFQERATYWQHPGEGLALFRSRDMFQSYLLPLGFQENVVVSDHFYLKPLFPLFTNDGQFYVLALSQNSLRLLKATHYSVQQVALPATISQSLADFLQYEERENETQSHSAASGALIGKGGRHATIFHGQGVGVDNEKDMVLRYFQQIDRGLHELLHSEKAPLVLAGVEYLFSIYHEANTYPHLLSKGITGNPDRLSIETLHAQAWTIVEPHFHEAQKSAARNFQQYATTRLASDDIKTVVLAAIYGRIETLFVALEQEINGHFDPTNSTVHVHREAKFKDDDLLDIAATQTFLHGGNVYAIDHTQIPGEKALAAIFRY